MPIVIDASALAEVVLRTERAPAVEALFEGEDLLAPDLVNAEVLSVVRGLLRRGEIDDVTAGRAVGNLARAPVRRMTTTGLVTHMWILQSHVTPYDASYVALAARLGTPLLTLDSRLARAPGLGVELRTV